MTHISHDRPNDDTRNETCAANGDPSDVKESELVAENMPSVIRRLRPMDISSNGILQYLMRKRNPSETG